MGGHPEMNRSAKGGARSSLHYGGEGVLIHPPHQGVCGRHGTEDLGVTPGGLSGSSGGTEGSDPISASEVGSGVLGVVGRPNSTRSAVKATRPETWRQSVSGKAAGEDGWGEIESEMSKADEVDSSLSERPEHHRPRRLADWINPTGASPKPATGMGCATTRSKAATAIQKWSRATARICWPCTPLRRPPHERARSTGALPLWVCRAAPQS